MRRCKVEYACVSSVGKVRQNNEDNYCCCGHIREDYNSVSDSEVSGEVYSDANELFAVFDGMGGESCGEIASYVAASEAASCSPNRSQRGEYLFELAERLNERVREETEKLSLVLMGATAAMLEVAGDKVYILNAGDSRIYKLSRHELRQISEEHTSPADRHAVTKFLGMPKGHSLRPYIAMGGYRTGDIFLLCSDGVTDMLTDEEIRAIIDDKRELSASARLLVDAALEKGGIDNTTAILLRFCK